MGDSCAANMIANRETTPLQGDISSVSCAQMIFFYIFGITPDFQGNVTVSPVKVRPSENMRIENARIAGKTFSISVQGDAFTVFYEGREYTASIGEQIVI